MTASDYEEWGTEALIDESCELYERYLHGDDTLDDLHAIAEILRRREQKEGPQPGGQVALGGGRN